MHLRKIISRGYYSTIHSHGWIVLFCAVILGRYYTDGFDVDEDQMTITDQGGWCIDGTFIGITHRDMCNPSTNLGIVVASSNMKKYGIIRIGTMSTKNWRLLPSKAGIGLMR